MSIRIVQLGAARKRGEGLRLGTVRRPPRGVPKSQYSARDFYDVWLPVLSPSPALIKRAQAARSEKDWSAFRRRFRAEMNQAAARQLLDLLAALSHHANFSLGCYCEDPSRCHRAVLKELLQECGASIT
jgi:uncharacterized protein YeaO (DUF488 family)